MHIDSYHLAALTSATWNTFGTVCAIALWLCPGILLLLRYQKSTKFSWWLVIIMALVIGWVLTIGTSFSTTNALSAQIREYEASAKPVPDQLMKDWAGDAHVVFALFFGWAFAAIIFIPWLILYGIMQGMRKALGTNRNSSNL